MLKLRDENGRFIKNIAVYEQTESDMGESNITATIKFDKPQAFHPDWYLDLEGEKFSLNIKKPAGKKDTSSISTQFTLVFKSEREDLKRYTFMDFEELGNNNPQPVSYVVPLYATLTEFVYRFNLNLAHYMGNRWRMELPQSYVESGKAIQVVFDNLKIWDVLVRVYELFGVRWVIRPEGNSLVIKVAEPAVEVEHIFEYGKDNGLVSVARNNDLERIITRLRGRGSERNLPINYFHKGSPDHNKSLDSVFFSNLMPKCYRDYIRGYNAGSGIGTWAYNQGVFDKANNRRISPVDYVVSENEALWGISYDAIEPNEEIYPTLRGATRGNLGRLDEIVDVEQVDTPRDFIPGVPVEVNTEPVKGSFAGTDGPTKTVFAVDCRDVALRRTATNRISISPQQSVNKVTFGLQMNPSCRDKRGYEIKGMGPFTLSASVFMQKSDGTLVGNFVWSKETQSFTAEDVAPGEYTVRAEMSVKAGNSRPATGSMAHVDYELEVNALVYEKPKDKETFKQTFDIWLKDIWNTRRLSGESDEDYTWRVWGPLASSEEMAVMFSDGRLAGDYEFRVVGMVYGAANLRQIVTAAIHPDDTKTTKDGVRSAWRLSLQKSDAEVKAGGEPLPNGFVQASPGDHMFFINIMMPYDPYVYDAEKRLEDYLYEQLSKMDEEFPSFTIVPSRIFCNRFKEIDKLHAGAMIRVRNVDLIGDSYTTLHIQQITVRHGQTLNPEWNITISDEVVATGNPIQTLQGDVKVLSSQVYSNREAVQEAVKILQNTFLRKDGISDTSYSPTNFTRRVNIGREGLMDGNFRPGDISGQGAGIYTDPDGNRVVEADIIVARLAARFNEVQINQTTYFGGKQIFSGAGMTVSKVEGSGSSWRCYFDTKNGTVNNLFKVHDGAYSQRFSAEGTNTYWARVTGVGLDYIEISKTDRMSGSRNPVVGDNIAQLGNDRDKSRQSALVIDMTRPGGGLVTWFDQIDGFTLEGKNNVDIGRYNGETWLNVFGNMYIGDRDINDPDATYITFQKKAGELMKKLFIKANIEIGPDSTGLENLAEWADKQQQIDNASQAGKANADAILGLTKQMAADKKNLQDQIDQQIQAWDGTEIPRLDNYPANKWKTNEERKKHTSDVYDRKIVDSQGKATFVRYRFSENKDTGVYEWIEIADNGSAQALAQAKEALGLAEGKNTIYYGDATPSKPVANDLWVKTDDTISIYLAGGWTTVNDAMLTLANMAKDNVITRQEKNNLRGLVSQITTELGTYREQAVKFNVLNDPGYTGLVDAGNELKRYLTEDVLVNSNTDTEIVRDTFNGKVAAYESAKTVFTNTITGNIKIGGTNIVLKSDVPAKSDEMKVKEYKLSVPWTSLAGKQVVISYDYEFKDVTTPSDSKIGVVNESVAGSAIWIKIDTPSGKGRRTEVITLPENIPASTPDSIFAKLQNRDGYASITRIKIEVGNKATDWSPAPEDLLDMEIGTANILDGSREFYLNETEFFSKVKLSPGMCKIIKQGTYNCYGKLPVNKSLIFAGRQYTLGFDIKISGNYYHRNRVIFGYKKPDGNIVSETILPENLNRWVRKYMTITIGNEDISTLEFFMKFEGESPVDQTHYQESLTIEYRDINMVAGNKGAAWSASENDLKEYYNRQAASQEKDRIGADYTYLSEQNGRYTLAGFAEYEARYSEYNTILANIIDGTVNVSEEELKVAQEAYYTAKTAVMTEIASKTDVDYLRKLFEQTTEIQGALLALLVGVMDENKNVVAGLNGSDNWTDTTYGKILMFAGAKNAQDIANALTKIYEKGHIETQSIHIHKNAVIDDGAVIKKGAVIENEVKVGGFELTDDGMVNVDKNADIFISIKNLRRALQAMIGSAGSDTSNYSAAGAFINHQKRGDYDAVSSNIGIKVSAQGANVKNRAIQLEGGCISGMAMCNEIVTSSKTLDKQVTNVIIANSSTITITLPAMDICDDGHVIRFRRMSLSSSAQVNIKCAQSKIYSNGETLTHGLINYNGTGFEAGYAGVKDIGYVGDSWEYVWCANYENRSSSGVLIRGTWMQYKLPKDW